MLETECATDRLSQVDSRCRRAVGAVPEQCRGRGSPIGSGGMCRKRDPRPAAISRPLRARSTGRSTSLATLGDPFRPHYWSMKAAAPSSQTRDLSRSKNHTMSPHAWQACTGMQRRSSRYEWGRRPGHWSGRSTRPSSIATIARLTHLEGGCHAPPGRSVGVPPMGMCRPHDPFSRSQHELAPRPWAPPVQAARCTKARYGTP